MHVVVPLVEDVGRDVSIARHVARNTSVLPGSPSQPAPPFANLLLLHRLDVVHGKPPRMGLGCGWAWDHHRHTHIFFMFHDDDSTQFQKMKKQPPPWPFSQRQYNTAMIVIQAERGGNGRWRTSLVDKKHFSAAVTQRNVAKIVCLLYAFKCIA